MSTVNIVLTTCFSLYWLCWVVCETCRHSW